MTGKLLRGAAALLTVSAAVLSAEELPGVWHTPGSPGFVPLLWENPGDNALLRNGWNRLFAGDLAGAAENLRLYRKNNPALDARWLPAGLLLARGENERALHYFSDMAESSLAPMEKIIGALMAGTLSWESGNMMRALHFFEIARKEKKIPRLFRIQAAQGEILTLIRSGLTDRAEERLNAAEKEFSGASEEFIVLELFNNGVSGNAAEVWRKWQKCGKKFPPHPDELLTAALLAGGNAAREKKQYFSAQELYAAAYHYAENDAARKEILSRLINVQVSAFPEKALKTIAKYLKFFPEDPERGDLELIQASLYVKTGKFDAAGELYASLLNSGNLSPQQRVSAALGGAVAAEKAEDFSLARQMYYSAISRTSDPGERGKIQLLLLEFLLRTKEYSSAAAFGEELSENRKIPEDRLNTLLLQAQSNLRHYREAIATAKKLARSSSGSYASNGAFHLAELTEKSGNLREARKLYLQFSSKYQDDPRTPGVKLAAAELAWKTGESVTSVREFAEFASRYPRHDQAPEALCCALHVGVLNPSLISENTMTRLLAELEKKYPDSPRRDQGVILFCRYLSEGASTALYRDRGRALALKMLEELLKRAPGGTEAPRAMLISGRLWAEKGKNAEALKSITSLLEKFPRTPLALDGCLEAGAISFRMGNYRKAGNFFERAAQLGGRSAAGEIARSQNADALLMIGTPEELEKAKKIYAEVVRTTPFPVLKIQALFKLGLSCEYSLDPMGAIKAYESLLEQAASDGFLRKVPGAADWCARSAPRALRLIMDSNLPNGSQLAQKICALYEMLHLKGSSAEVKKYLQSIKKHYNLLD